MGSGRPLVTYRQRLELPQRSVELLRDAAARLRTNSHSGHVQREPVSLASLIRHSVREQNSQSGIGVVVEIASAITCDFWSESIASIPTRMSIEPEMEGSIDTARL